MEDDKKQIDKSMRDALVGRNATVDLSGPSAMDFSHSTIQNLWVNVHHRKQEDGIEQGETNVHAKSDFATSPEEIGDRLEVARKEWEERKTAGENIHAKAEAGLIAEDEVKPVGAKTFAASDGVEDGETTANEDTPVGSASYSAKWERNKSDNESITMRDPITFTGVMVRLMVLSMILILMLVGYKWWKSQPKTFTGDVISELRAANTSETKSSKLDL